MEHRKHHTVRIREQCHESVESLPATFGTTCDGVGRPKAMYKELVAYMVILFRNVSFSTR